MSDTFYKLLNCVKERLIGLRVRKRLGTSPMERLVIWGWREGSFIVHVMACNYFWKRPDIPKKDEVNLWHIGYEMSIKSNT